jgi:hypothetical protein
MKFLVLLLSLLSFGCSKSVSSLEETFGTDHPGTGTAAPVRSVSITGQTKRDFTVFETGSKLSLNAKTAIIELPGVKPLMIPTSKIAGCTMVCFGGAKWDVDLLIPATGSSIAFEHSKDLYEWCWNNRLPMVSGEASRNWLYLKTPLPDRESFASVVASRAAYDKQAKRACNGY